MSSRPSMRVSIPNPWGPPPLAPPATPPLPALTPFPAAAAAAVAVAAASRAAVLFVLVEPASPQAVELLAEALVRFLALCPPWLSVVRNPLLSLGNHLRFGQHPQCSATQLLRNDLVNVKMTFLFRTACCNADRRPLWPRCLPIHCVQPNSPAGRFRTERESSKTKPRPTTKAATTRLRYHWNDFFIRGPLFLSADSLDGFT